MHATYHFNSAQELNQEVFDAIKLAFKSKPITLIVEEENHDFILTEEMKTLLNERLEEDTHTYIPVEEVMRKIKSNYGL